MASSSFPDPTFNTKARDINRIYCEICRGSWSKKSPKGRKKFITLKEDSFKEIAVKWSKREHKFNLVIKNVPWNSTDTMRACSSCYSTFFKEDYLNEQDFITEPPTKPISPPILKTPSPTTSKVNAPRRSSQRQKLTYSTDRERKEKTTCIICYKIKRNKGRLVPVTIITLRSNDSKKHFAENSLKYFASVHIRDHNTKYIDAAERINLVAGMKSLYDADVGYHISWYKSFCSPKWNKVGLTKEIDPENEPDSFSSS